MNRGPINSLCAGGVVETPPGFQNTGPCGTYEYVYGVKQIAGSDRFDYRSESVAGFETENARPHRFKVRLQSADGFQKVGRGNPAELLCGRLGRGNEKKSINTLGGLTMNMFKKFLGMAMALALVALVPISASAVGTNAGTALINGTFTTGDTIPAAAGGLSFQYTSDDLTDSQYKGTVDTVTEYVDSAWDLRPIVAQFNSKGKAGDTVVYGAYSVVNMGNIPTAITINISHLFITDSGINWGSESYRVFRDGNQNGSYESTQDTEASTLTLAADAGESVIITVWIPDTAVLFDTSASQFKVTDNAPNNNGVSTGDAWEAGIPLAAGVNDQYDTQTDNVLTLVKGPNLIAAKQSTVQSLSASGPRPGDTITYTLTYDNDGNDSAYNTILYDAIPANTVLAVGPNPVDDTTPGNRIVVSDYENTLGDDDFNDTSTTSVAKMRFRIDSSEPDGADVSEDDGDGSDVQIGTTGVHVPTGTGTDGGQLTYRVIVQ